MPTAGAAETAGSGPDWADLPAAWRASFELAWDAFRQGSPPVGAVVTDPDGRIVARGRSRRAETTAPTNQLAGSRLAHAEVNALAQLTPDQHDGYVLYSTLEPCLLCSAAMSIAHVRELHFAGPDPMWRFVNELPGSHLPLEDRWYTAHGPMSGPLAAWATLLPLVERIQRRPDGRRIEELERTSPALVQLAQRVVADGTAVRMADLSLDDALQSLWDELPSL